MFSQLTCHVGDSNRRSAANPHPNQRSRIVGDRHRGPFERCELRSEPPTCLAIDGRLLVMTTRRIPGI